MVTVVGEIPLGTAERVALMPCWCRTGAAMIEEPGRVVALDDGAVWVETRKSTCSGCSGKNGCGQGLMDTLGVREQRGLIRALSDLQLQVGDSVIVGVREDVLLRGAVLVYLLPLLMLMAAATLAAKFCA